MFSVGPDVVINHHNTVIRLTHGLDSPIQMAVDSRAIPTFDNASLSVCSRSIPTSAAFISTEARTSSITDSTDDVSKKFSSGS